MVRKQKESGNDLVQDWKCNMRTVSIRGRVVREPKMVSTSCGSFEEVHQPLWSRASFHRSLLVPLEWAGAEGKIRREASFGMFWHQMIKWICVWQFIVQIPWQREQPSPREDEKLFWRNELCYWRKRIFLYAGKATPMHWWLYIINFSFMYSWTAIRYKINCGYCGYPHGIRVGYLLCDDKSMCKHLLMSFIITIYSSF